MKVAVEETKTDLEELFEGKDSYTGPAWVQLNSLLSTDEMSTKGPWVLDTDSDLNRVYYDSGAEMHCLIPLTCTSRTGQRGRPVICNADPTLVSAAGARMKTQFASISLATRLDLGELRQCIYKRCVLVNHTDHIMI